MTSGHGSRVSVEALDTQMITASRALMPQTGPTTRGKPHLNGQPVSPLENAQALVGDVGALASIGSVGDSYDNAMAESLNGIYKTECIRHEGPWVNAGDIELATSSWVSYYNSSRLHSSIGYRSPIEYEKAYYAGELAGPDHTPADGSHQADHERHNDRDINPRTPEHAG